MAKPSSSCTREDEYETQLYGFCQKDLIEHLKSSLDDQISNSASGLKKALLDAQTSDKGKQAVEVAISSLINQCLESSVGPFERLTEQVQAFFSLPNHILLPEDKAQRNRYTQDDESKEKQELEKVKSRFRRAQFLKASFIKELEEALQVEAHMESFNHALAHLENINVWTKSNKAEQFHKLTQSLLGLEVTEASLKLSDQPSCGESDTALEDAILSTYTAL